MLGALWHLARDGCVWRRLPIGPGLPPHQSVWSRFTRWRLRAVLDRALAVLVACRRLAAGRKRRPTAAIIDTQSVKAGPAAGAAGVRRGQEFKGRKRVLMVDVEGDPLGIRVVPADVHEHRALRALAPDLAAHPTLRLAWLDRGFAGDEPEAFLNGHAIAAEVVESGTSRASSSRSGAGRSSRPSAACSATAACGSTTRRAPTPRGT